MSEQSLTIGSEGFALPLALITSTQAILARKRRGKTYTASVEAEGMLTAGAQVAVIDPTGAWWGLRAGADGSSEGGFPVTIFGGEHQDAALNPSTGKAMARALIDHSFSAIFDLSSFTTEEQWTFVRDLAAEMLRANRSPIHLFIDEADTFAPQQTRSTRQFECLGAVTRLVRQGGIKSLGVTMITQRSSSINWDVLSQIDMLTVLQMGADVDIKPVVAWLGNETSKAFADDAKLNIPKLAVGEAFIGSATFEIATRIQVRERRTFNSGRTLKFGEQAAKAVLKPVDAAKLGAEIAAAVQKAKQEDPEFLRTEVKRLEAALAAKGEVPMGLAEDIAAMEREIEELRPLRERVDQLQAELDRATAMMRRIGQELLGLADESPEAIALVPVPVSRPVQVRSPPATIQPVGDGTSWGTAERKIMGALSRLKAVGVHTPARLQVALFAGYGNVKSGGFAGPAARLTDLGMIVVSSGTLALTPVGERAIGVSAPATTADLHGQLRGLLSGPEWTLLEFLIRAYPRPISRGDLAEKAGYSNVKSGGFAGPVAKLTTLGLAKVVSPGQIVGTDMLFVGGRR